MPEGSSHTEPEEVRLEPWGMYIYIYMDHKSFLASSAEAPPLGLVIVWWTRSWATPNIPSPPARLGAPLLNSRPPWRFRMFWWGGWACDPICTDGTKANTLWKKKHGMYFHGILGTKPY